MMIRVLLLLCVAFALTATSALATVYYRNDFESGSAGDLTLDSRWQLLPAGGVGDSAAIRLTYDRAGTPGTQAVLELTPYDTQEFRLEFDTRIEGEMNGGMKFVKVFGSSTTPSQNNFTFIMDYDANILNRVLYYEDTLCEVSLGGTGSRSGCEFTPVRTSAPIDLRGNEWHHVTIDFRRAVPGTSTGEYRVWIDGSEKVHFTGVNNNSPASSATDRIAALHFGDYTHTNAATWYFWIDNLTVSSGEAAESPPAGSAAPEQEGSEAPTGTADVFIPALLAPAHQARDLPTDIIFDWSDPPDSRPVSYTLYVGTDPALDDELAVAGSRSGREAGAALAGARGLALAGLFGLALYPRRKRLAAPSRAAALGGLLLLAACGSGGDSGTLAGDAGAGYTHRIDDLGSSSFEMHGLEPATTYYWKVAADDGHSVTVSKIRAFATAAPGPGAGLAGRLRE